jgi:hypothetical protein
MRLGEDLMPVAGPGVDSSWVSGTKELSGEAPEDGLVGPFWRSSNWEVLRINRKMGCR